MQISLLAAIDESGAIGKAGGLPWRLPTDLRRFKRLTMGHTIVMGRTTFDSIGRPLPGRRNLVITRQPQYCPDGVLCLGSLPAAIELALQAGESELFITGGAQVYTLALPYASVLHLTRVHTRTSGADTFFPTIGWADWRCIVRDGPQQGTGDEYAFTFETYVRSR